MERKSFTSEIKSLDTTNFINVTKMRVTEAGGTVAP